MLKAAMGWPYHKVYDGFWDKRGASTLHLVRNFTRVHGYSPRLVSPRTFNERALHQILFDRNPIRVTFASKVASRDFVHQRMRNADALVPLLGIVDKADDIPQLNLPARFVMKASHGSGMVRIYDGKSAPDMAHLRSVAKEWLQAEFGKHTGEWFYKKVKKQVMFEELLTDSNGDVPKDYKFFCYRGRVWFVQVDSDRFSRHARDLFDRDWVPIDGTFQYPNASERPAPPKDLGSMIAIAEQLSAGIDFVRVDLYDAGSSIKFGEMTNAPEAGMGVFAPRELDETFGRPWK